MAKTNYPHLGNEGAPGFDWDLYDDGWNGKSLKRNSRVKLKKSQEANNVVVYSHERYAAKMMKAYFRDNTPVSPKEHVKGDVLDISDIRIMNDGTALATVRGGAVDIAVDLDKEQRFFNNIQMGDKMMDKEGFIQCVNIPEVKKAILGMNLSVKVGADREKASLWDGFVASLQKEMMEQITQNNKAYMAHVIEYNDFGLIVEIFGAVRAFLPGSHISTLNLNVPDFSGFVGQDIQVMVESYNALRKSFVVSHSKFIKYTYQTHMSQLIESLNENPDMMVTGTITNVTDFGVFVVVDEYISGMLHKTLVSDDLRQAMREGTVSVGEKINIFYHRIDTENNRVIFSDVPLADRDAIIARREAEDAAEKAQAEANASAE